MPISLTNKSKRKKNHFKEDNFNFSYPSCELPCTKDLRNRRKKKVFHKLFYAFFVKEKYHEKTFPLSICGCASKAPIRNALTHSNKNKFPIFISHSFHWKFSSVGARSIFLVHFRHFKQRKKRRKKWTTSLICVKICFVFFINSHINRCWMHGRHLCSNFPKERKKMILKMMENCVANFR